MAARSRALPSGRVTFAFTDVVSSTRTFIEHGEAYVEALRSLHDLIAEHAARANGVVVETEGDGAFLAFPDAASATDSLLALQNKLEADRYLPGLRLRIRAGVHTGEAVPVGDHYLALPVYVAARVAGASGAGQLLGTEEVIKDLVAASARVVDTAVEVGTYRLKDIPEPLRLWRFTGDPTPPRATPARRTNVRPSRTSFLGRDDDMARLRELTAEPGVVTVVGPGGTGKTRLVSEFALSDAEMFTGGAWLVELATIETAEQLVPTIASAVGLSSAEIGDVVDELGHRGRTVLVLDNCEHLIDPVVDAVEVLRAGCPDLTLLGTSRESLRVPEEWVFALSPLVAHGAATQLFVDRALAAAGTGLALERVAEVCEALDNLPLAIELAACHAGAAPMQELLDAVTAGAETLTRRGGSSRQRSLDEVLQWSLDRIDPRTRDSLLVLSVFPGRFSREMAEAVLEVCPRTDPVELDTLARASLVDLDGEDYRLLVTIRAAALRLLAREAGLRREALDSLTRWTKDFGVDNYDLLRRSHDDIPDDTVLALEAGIAHSLDVGIRGLGKAWQIINMIGNMRGVSAAQLANAKRALELEVDDLDSVLTLHAAARAFSWHDEGRVELSASKVSAMLRVARATDDPLPLERVLTIAADLALQNGVPERGLELRHEILELTQTRPECRHQLAAALINLANHHMIHGELDEAADYAARSAEEAASQQLKWSSQAVARAMQGEISLLQGKPEPARDHVIAALAIAAPTWRLRPWALALLARASAALGDRAGALTTGREAVPHLRELATHDAASGSDLDALLAAVPELAPLDGRAHRSP